MSKWCGDLNFNWFLPAKIILSFKMIKISKNIAEVFVDPYIWFRRYLHLATTTQTHARADACTHVRTHTHTTNSQLQTPSHTNTPLYM